MNKKIINYIPILTMLPAIIVGAIAMNINNISNFIYLQNILCFITLNVVYYSLLKNKHIFYKIEPLIYIIICIVALLFSFVNTGVDDVHRWISIGGVQLYISSIVMPIVIINLWSLLKRDKLVIVIISIVFISLLLTLQPDASMVASFSIVALLLIWTKINTVSRFLLSVFLGSLTLVSWIFLDQLAPISYVEGIFSLVIDIGILGIIFGTISIALMIIPFLFFPPNKNKVLSIGFGVYYIIILISNLIGNFPVPLMGYGISPIIGYFISISWFTENKINSL